VPLTARSRTGAGPLNAKKVTAIQITAEQDKKADAIFKELVVGRPR
jgi:hypothetical protein